jgi:hypothetical protein
MDQTDTGNRQAVLVRRIGAVKLDAERKGQRPLADLCMLLIEEFGQK